MYYISRKETVASLYRKVEAMYRRNCDVYTIMNALDMTKLEVLDTVQKIFAMDMRRQAQARVI